MTAHRKSFLAIFVFIVVFVSGCGSSPRSTVNVVPELPAEQTTLVTISDILDVYAYNGIDITKTWYPTGKKRVVKATLPAGETTLSFNIYGSIRVGLNEFVSVNIEDVEIRYNFEAGKEYAINILAEESEESNFFRLRHDITLKIWETDPSVANSSSIVKSWLLGKT